MVLKKKLSFELDDVVYDYKLFDTLKSIRNNKSQRKSAKSLGISHAVLNRRILDAESKLSEKLVVVSNKGSSLTEFAFNLLELYESYENRLKDSDDVITVAGGVVSSEFLRQLAIAYQVDNLRILETDLETSFVLARMGVVDILGFDDPVQAYIKNIEPVPLGRDSLMLLNHGESFNKVADLDSLNFVEVEGSAQRLAWTTLADNDLNFNIVSSVRSFHEAIRMVEQDEKLFTFINKSMTYRCQNVSNILSEDTKHIISALNVKNDSYIDNFLNFASHNAQKTSVKFGFEKL